MPSLQKTLEKELADVKAIAGVTGVDAAAVVRVITEMMRRVALRKRRKASPPPQGGISLRAAGRKYGVDYRTIGRWVKRGIVPVVRLTRNELYIEEGRLLPVVEVYRRDPGRGKKTVTRRLHARL